MTRWNIVFLFKLHVSRYLDIAFHFKVNKDQRLSINFDEFLKIIADYQNEEQSVDDICEAFSAFDEEGSGIVPTKDLRHALVSLGEKLSEDEVYELIKLADPKKDGKIRYKSFVEGIEGKKRKGKKRKNSRSTDGLST